MIIHILFYFFSSFVDNSVIGKVASDYSHKWVFNEPQDHETNNNVAPWNNPADFVSFTYLSNKRKKKYLISKKFLNYFCFILFLSAASVPKDMGCSVPIWYQGKHETNTKSPFIPSCICNAYRRCSKFSFLKKFKTKGKLLQ